MASRKHLWRFWGPVSEHRINPPNFPDISWCCFRWPGNSPKEWRPAVVIARKSFPLGHGLAVAVTCCVKDKRTWMGCSHFLTQKIGPKGSEALGDGFTLTMSHHVSIGKWIFQNFPNGRSCPPVSSKEGKDSMVDVAPPNIWELGFKLLDFA